MDLPHTPLSDASASPRETPARAWRVFRPLESLLATFSPFERLLLYVFSILLAGSTLALIIGLNASVSTEVPTRGGSIVEGAVGTPRFINPLLAVSQSDQDLTTLIYSGLMRATPDGYVVDLASHYEISEDGTLYTFRIRDDATFHDGTPLTAKDVVFTIARAQNPDTKSPRRADWEGVVIGMPDEHTVTFTLPSAYAPFLENATIGILPAHLWEGVSASDFQFTQLNTNPVGSGPYRINDTKTDASGAPTEYELVPFRNFALGAPHITRIVYRIFPTEQALLDAAQRGTIDSFIAASPKQLPDVDGATVRIPLTRVFAVFLNQSHAPILADAAVRKALNQAVDRDSLVESVLGGFGSSIESPVPPGLLTTPATTSFANDEERIAAARATLASGGWKWNEGDETWTKGDAKLTLSLATSDADELQMTANAVADNWRAIGVAVDVHTYPITEFNQTVMRPRNYDAILFGEIVGRSMDLFAFWHSSQRNDPGLNLSLYTNAKADKALASARAEDNRKLREQNFKEFLGFVAEDTPAVFLYSPELAYIVPSYLNGVDIGALTTPAERFLGAHQWYRDTERVWNIFAPRVTE